MSEDLQFNSGLLNCELVFRSAFAENYERNNKTSTQGGIRVSEKNIQDFPRRVNREELFNREGGRTTFTGSAVYAQLILGPIPNCLEAGGEWKKSLTVLGEFQPYCRDSFAGLGCSSEESFHQKVSLPGNGAVEGDINYYKPHHYNWIKCDDGKWVLDVVFKPPNKWAYKILQDRYGKSPHVFSISVLWTSNPLVLYNEGQRETTALHPPSSLPVALSNYHLLARYFSSSFEIVSTKTRQRGNQKKRAELLAQQGTPKLEETGKQNQRMKRKPKPTTANSNPQKYSVSPSSSSSSTMDLRGNGNNGIVPGMLFPSTANSGVFSSSSLVNIVETPSYLDQVKTPSGNKLQSVRINPRANHEREIRWKPDEEPITISQGVDSSEMNKVTGWEPDAEEAMNGPCNSDPFAGAIFLPELTTFSTELSGGKGGNGDNGDTEDGGVMDVDDELIPFTPGRATCPVTVEYPHCMETPADLCRSG